MSHALPSEPAPFEELSDEEQIQYIEDHLDEIVAELRANKSIPSWHVEILAERMARERAEFEAGIPWEEIAREFMKN